ncbi:uncharacterized protein LOC142985244 [Anticarsia gemmatalis]|uniref:uncharacterized protein LOC142985244 n=1 Tax=Anticarsia gemmatalis TaxID=129554 RepID=UPI003F776633
MLQQREELRKLVSNVKEVLQCSNASPLFRRGNVGYICCYCPLEYPNPADLKTHCHTEHTHQYNPASFYMRSRKAEYFVRLDITDLKCKLCSENIDSLEDLLQHLIEHKRPIYTDIRNQIMPFKFDTDAMKCCKCPSVFERFKMLQEHMNTHYRNYICDVCDLGFLIKGSLIRHLATHKLGTFKCSFCHKTYDTVLKKKYHEKAVHILMSMTSVCSYCNERFPTNFKKEDHLAAVHGICIEKYKCRACDKTFKRKGALSIHTRKDHLMERNHKCVQCDMKFFTSTQLQQHMVKHTGVKAFKCTVCCKSYGRRKTLAEHMKIHNDVKRFKCEHCGHAFVQKCAWKSHFRIRHADIVL